MAEQNEFAKETEEEKKRELNDENIRNLYNKLIEAINPKTPKLEFRNKFIKYEFYKNHIEVMLIRYIEGYKKLALVIFRDLFEDEDKFGQYSKNKERLIELIISVIKKSEDEENKPIIKKEFLDKHENLKEIYFALTALEIDEKYIYLLLTHLFIKGKEIKNLIGFLDIILRESFPNSKVNFDDAIEINYSIEKFLAQLVELYNKNKDYFTCDFELFYDKNQKQLVFKPESNEDIIKKIQTPKQKKNKKKKKKQRNSEENKNENQIIYNDKEKIDEIGKIGTISQKLKEKNKIKEEAQNSEEKKNKGKNSEVKIESEGVQNLEPENQTKTIIPPLFSPQKEETIKEAKTEDQKNISKAELMKRIIQLEEEIKKLNVKQEEEINKLNIKSAKQEEEIKKTNQKVEEQNEYIYDLLQTIEDKNKVIEKIKKNNEEFSDLISKSKDDIEEIKFILKMISLRTLYKSFFDVLIYIFGLQEKNNIEYKFYEIGKYLNNKKGEEMEELKLLSKNILGLLKFSNFQAHYIDLSKSLISQLIEVVKKYKSKEYPKLVEFLKKTSFENRLKDLVELRTNKFSMKNEIFKKKECIIINNIKNDDDLKNKFRNVNI